MILIENRCLHLYWGWKHLGNWKILTLQPYRDTLKISHLKLIRPWKLMNNKYHGNQLIPQALPGQEKYIGENY